MTIDMVDHPLHYNSHPSGVEVYEITKHLNFALGNAFKYIARFDKKGSPVEDLKKAVWYLNAFIKDKKVDSYMLMICGNREVLKANLGKYRYYEPDGRVVGFVTLFMAGVLKHDLLHDEAVDIFGHLRDSLEHMIREIQVSV